MSSEKVTEYSNKETKDAISDIPKQFENKRMGIQLPEVAAYITMLDNAVINIQLQSYDVIPWIDPDFRDIYRNDIQTAIEVLNTLIKDTTDYLIEKKEEKA